MDIDEDDEDFLEDQAWSGPIDSSPLVDEVN